MATNRDSADHLRDGKRLSTPAVHLGVPFGRSLLTVRSPDPLNQQDITFRLLLQIVKQLPLHFEVGVERFLRAADHRDVERFKWRQRRQSIAGTPRAVTLGVRHHHSIFPPTLTASD